MTTIHRTITIAALLCIGTWSEVQGDAAPGSVVGGFAEIANSVSGALPGQKPEPKRLKSPAHFGERVITEAGSRANISFIDGSHVLLGEKAEMTIDAFVFDPKTGAEQATYQVAVGALRIVSGAIKHDKLKILTPTAAIAVRGTNLKVRVLESGETLVSVNRGQVDITSRRTGETASLGAGQNVTADQQGLSDVDSGEAEVEDGFVDDVAYDGDPDLADVALGDLGFSDEEANEIESAVADAESEGDSEGADNADSDNADSEGGDSDSGDSDSGDSDSGDSGGGDSGGGDSGGGEGGGGGDN